MVPEQLERDLLAAALERVGDRWSLRLIGVLLGGPQRFGELQHAVPGVASNVLATRLRELERHGLVVAEPYSYRPLRVEYRATARAEALAGALRMLAAWGSGLSGQAEPVVHQRCGTPLEVRHFCPTCQEALEDEEDVWV